MPEKERIFNPDSLLAFLRRDVLKPDDDVGRQLCRRGPIGSIDLVRIARLQQSGRGPTEATAADLLHNLGTSVEEYERFCRDSFAHPYEEKVSVDWFARW